MYSPYKIYYEPRFKPFMKTIKMYNILIVIYINGETEETNAQEKKTNAEEKKTNAAEKKTKRGVYAGKRFLLSAIR